MTDARNGLEAEAPPPRPGRRWGLVFATAGSAFAWFVQLVSSYALFSLPCFAGPERQVALPDRAQWVWSVTLILYAACLLIALLSALAAWRVYRRAKAGDPEGRDSRDCFLGCFGLLLGVGFSTIIAASLLSFLVVPPCAL